MPPPPQGQIKIDDVSVSHISFERVWVPGTTPETIPIELDFDYRTTQLTSKSVMVAATISVWREQPSVPFRASITYELRASVESDAEIGILNEFSKANALSVLVPYIREALANITARSGFTPLLLPPVNAQTLLELVRARKETGAP